MSLKYPNISATISDDSDNDEEKQEKDVDEEVEAINAVAEIEADKATPDVASVAETESTQPGSNPEPKSILRKKSKYEQQEVTNKRVAELRNGSVASMALPGKIYYQKLSVQERLTLKILSYHIRMTLYYQR